MTQRWHWIAAVLLAQGCTRDPAIDDPAAASLDPKSSAVFGQAPQNEPPEAARRIATRAVESASSQCGGGCSADLEAGRQRLAAGNMHEAFEALRCGDSPAAAFGAGIAKLLGVVESAAGDQLLHDIGQPPFPASDLFGPDGYLARVAARWNGSAQLTTSGAVSMNFMSERVMADDWELSVRHNDGARRVSMYVEYDGSWAPGTVVALRYNCAGATAGAGASLMPGPYLNVTLNVYEGDEQLECRVLSSMPAGACTPDGGSMRVVSSGTTAGAHVEFEFDDVLLSCREGDLDTPVVPSADARVVRLNGKVAATITTDVDTSGLHSAFEGDKDETLIDRIDPALTVADFMNHGAAIAGELATARCYFDKAAQGSGTVFTVPGALHAGDDLALDAGDARMFGAAAAAGAALIELAGSYEYQLPLRSALCFARDDLDEHPSCPTEAAFVQSANMLWKSARIRHDRIEASHRLLALALADFEAGVPKLSATSGLANNPISAPAWRIATDFARAGQQSLMAGMVALPHVAPAIRIDLRSFFAEPPDPSMIAMPLLTRTVEDCFECGSDLEIERAYVSEFFDDTDADFESGDYEFAEEDALEEGLREVLMQLDAAGLFTGG